LETVQRRVDAAGVHQREFVVAVVAEALGQALAYVQQFEAQRADVEADTCVPLTHEASTPWFNPDVP
jgi:hypothetical protein